MPPVCVSIPTYEGREVRKDKHYAAPSGAWGIFGQSFSMAFSPYIMASSSQQSSRQINWQSPGQTKALLCSVNHFSLVSHQDKDCISS
jgi:hypothetical protein